MTTPTIPTIDLAALTGAPEQAAEQARAVASAFDQVGLVYLTNHGVSLERMHLLYDEYQRFTAEPLEKKERLSSGDIWYQRGWTPPNTERAVVAGGQPDFKECYFAAPLESAPEDALDYPELYADNRWPAGYATFAELYLELGRAVHRAGEALLSLAALALGEPADTFTRRIQGGPHVFRLLRYLPLSAEQIEANVLWGEEHTDFNLLTLLPGGRFHGPTGERAARPDDGSGLFLRAHPDADHPKGQLIAGTPPPGCLVAQVGQQLEILSGGRFHATPHIITAPRTPGYSRLSAAHFVHLHSREVLAPLPSCLTEASRRAYSPPVLAGTYSIKTLVDIGLAPPSALDQLGYRHYARLAEVRAD
ncbi:MAG: isopenicillin N synthase family oxygenase [Polyangiaceae bacterium]|nr:isopenicillin N synthase family oxygenase [Polyangiaceae bacterium]